MSYDTDPLLTEVLQRVRDHADSLGLSPNALCLKVGIAESTWHRWKNGQNTPTINTLNKLLDYQPRA